MGRSFDRGGQNRKERERGKRRSYRQAERDREARDAAADATVIAMPEPQPKIPVVVIEQKRPGFFAQVINRFFKKSA
jgi:hypothetical protein